MSTINTEILKGVEKTMLLPLWGRYTESKKKNGLIQDMKCIEVVESMGIDFSNIEKEQHPLSRLAWIARAWNSDHEINNLMCKDQEYTVICLGCGLDTAYFRLKRNNIHWYDMDLPNVMEIRKKLLGISESITVISESILESSSYETIEVKGKLIVLALGILYYFTESEIKIILNNIASLSDDILMIMDYFSEKGVIVSNKMVLQNNQETKMIWYANNPEDIVSLHPGIQLVESYPMFHKINPYLSEDQKVMASISDSQSINSLAVLKIK